MSYACRLSKKHYEEVAAAFPELSKSNFRAALEQWIEKLKAGQAAAPPVLSESGGQGSPPSPAVGGEAVSPESKTLKHDWTQVPECPLRQEDRNLCIWKAPRKKAIIEEIDPEICKRCEFVLKLNEKIKQIELEAIEKRAEIERDRLERERLKLQEEEEKRRREQLRGERGPTRVYLPDGTIM